MTRRRHVDTRLHYDRTECHNLQWQWQREDLIGAYLQWQAGLNVVETETSPENDPHPPFDMVLIDFFGMWFLNSRGVYLVDNCRRDIEANIQVSGGDRASQCDLGT